MLFYTGLFLLVIAVSLDGFGVGVTYGMRKIHVPVNALFIIMCCSGIVVLLSMTIGNLFTTFLSPNIASMLGGFILIAIGIFSLVNIFRPKTESPTEASDKQMSTFKTVLTTPDKADLDQSGTISINEAILLGIALALDAFGAGIGASMLGYSPVLTPILIALMSGIFVYCGIHIGILLSKSKHLQNVTFIPPLLLITLGILNIL
ncbi:sporulation membrane protein YtaF [Oceanobacillus halotolerans]|uniref:sporulation membrane protein YtaF n=1 Tax=Oceanobacillus halotolerans TaxID=2663380 RepID=UPI0013DA3BE0|nr:sporulation membrane protein YtaF [Oceanobacillus halotolerans]